MSERQIVTFSIGNANYGIDVQQVREVVTYRKCTRIPKMPSFIEGLMNLRGQVVLVVNLKGFLDIPENERREEGSGKIIIIDAPDLHIGFLVGEVYSVTRISNNDVEAPPTSSQRIITGIFKKGEDLIMIMDALKAIEALRENIGGTPVLTPQTEEVHVLKAVEGRKDM